MWGKVVSVNISPKRGGAKKPVETATLVTGYGLEGDAHAGGEHQVSLLAFESVNAASPNGLKLKPGDFGENLTTEGMNAGMVVGQRLRVGNEAILQISNIGKTCDFPCNIGQRLGKCIMPEKGVFAKVMRGGKVSIGDAIETIEVHVGAVITSSDRCARGEREDESGPVLVKLMRELSIELADYSVLPDEKELLQQKLEFLADCCAVDIVLTTGGTGLGVRDRMPEATLAVIDSEAPGISEALRNEGMKHTIYACMSRGVSGLRGRTLIINLPGSVRAVSESSILLKSILPHILEVIRSDVIDCGLSKRYSH